MRQLQVLLGLLTVVGVLQPTAVGATVIFNVGSGDQAAEASFTVTATNQLEIVLANTSTTAAADFSPAKTLTGIFFDIPDTVTLTPVSATAEDVIQESQNSSGAAAVAGADVNVGGEFAYRSAAWWFAPNADQGISAAKYIGGNNAERQGNMAGDNLHLSTRSTDYADFHVGGADFGVVPDAYTSTSNNHLSSRPLVQNSVSFLLDIGGTLTESQIGYAYFVYGKNKGDLANPPDLLYVANGNYVIPEPASLALLSFGATALFLGGRRRRSSFRS